MNVHMVSEHISSVSFKFRKHQYHYNGRVKMQDCKPCFTLMASNVVLTITGDNYFEDLMFYRSVMVAIQYIITLTRPNLSFAIDKYCQVMFKPTWNAVKRVLYYLHITVMHGLLLKPCK